MTEPAVPAHLERRRRDVLDSLDAERLRRLLEDHPTLAREPMRGWRDHPRGVTPLGYVAMLRYDTRDGTWRDVLGSGALARLLLDAGAPVDGEPDERETPLMTAASYGDAEVARGLIDAGAALDVLSSDTAGGVPRATALLHAAVFGMTEVLDLLVSAGAGVRSLPEAAAAGDVSGWLAPDGPIPERNLALVMAADHERLDVIDVLLDAGTPVDAEDAIWGRQALRLAASNGRHRSVRHLLGRGAHPDHRDPKHGLTALEWCRRDRLQGSPGRAEVESLLSTLS